MKTIDVCVIDPKHGVLRVSTTDDDGSGIGDFIRSVVGGWFDCVYPFSPDPDAKVLDIVGYVHDEGLLDGLEPNIIASALFGRYLVGRCVVVGVTNPDGQYDGGSYDVPHKAMQVMEWLEGAFQLWRESSVHNEALLKEDA
jgi:hypothetical protein